MKTFLLLVFLSFATVLTSCSVRPPESGQTTEMEPVKIIERNFPAEVLARGEKLYSENCSICHGTSAEGAPNWRKRSPDGKNSPPPINGTGHAWHHSSRSLKRAIWEGTKTYGGSMPGFSEKMTDEEVEILVTWITSLWPDKTYSRWKLQDDKAMAKAKAKEKQ